MSRLINLKFIRRLKPTIWLGHGAVTGTLSSCAGERGLLRWNSSRPPFDFKSTFISVDSPAPKWSLGDGLPCEISQWNEVISNSKRRTWDLSNAEDMKNSYRLLTSAIVPRPIAFVSTLSAEGQPNLAPFRFVVSDNPPMVSVSFSLSTRRPKNTRNNIVATKEFTISIISEPFAEAANATSVGCPADKDEWIISGLTKENSTVVKPSFVRESAIGMECELYSFQDITPSTSSEPSTTVVLGLIKKIHVRESVLNEDGVTVNPAKLRPIARLGGTTYARLLEGFDLPRPSWKAIKDEYPNLARKSRS
ncbi:hypothetical protein BDZ97DRAFT_1976813 [Flammula alnicola]|nr:hypothetical protein BDZ97DRAFT_1976813 [Flammula alnicola]